MSGAGPMAIVLSGGGARGAYEAGVLDVVLREVGRGRPGRFDFVCGTSVGAVNGAFLAAVADEPGDGMERLVEHWTSLSLERVLGFGWKQAAGLRRLWTGGDRPASLFDGRRLALLVGRAIDWRHLRANLAHGVLQALTVTATEVVTGMSTVFVDRGPDASMPEGLPRSARAVPTEIGAAQVLASAAIPLVFPAVAVDGDLYLDGGLRLNTPIAPAIGLGTARLLVVGLTAEQDPSTARALPPGRYPGAAFLFGKVLDAFFGDQVQDELDGLRAVNRMLRDGIAAYGSAFVPKLDAAAAERSDPQRRVVHPLVIRPSVDIGVIADQHLRSGRARFGRSLGRLVLRVLDLAEGADADLASYLLFDGPFARDLVQLGQRDARAKRAEIEAFLDGEWPDS